jgi:hypothetical protein
MINSRIVGPLLCLKIEITNPSIDTQSTTQTTHATRRKTNRRLDQTKETI